MLVKVIVDWLARSAQAIEERRSPDATLLALRRSIQLDSYSCGAQSAFSVLEYFGRARSINAVTRALGTDENGTSTAALLRLFRRRGLKPHINARAAIKDLAEAIDLGVPSIVSMDDGAHWATVFGYARGAIFLADPSLRKSLRVRVPSAPFRARWDRWAMVVRP